MFLSPSNLSGLETDSMAANPKAVMGMKMIPIASNAARMEAVKYLDSPSAISTTSHCRFRV